METPASSESEGSCFQDPYNFLFPAPKVDERKVKKFQLQIKNFRYFCQKGEEIRSEVHSIGADDDFSEWFVLNIENLSLAKKK